MCSQSVSLTNRIFRVRPSDRTCAGRSACARLSRRSLSTILDRGGSDLDIALEFLGERLIGEGDLPADILVGPVLARGLDPDRVLAGRQRLLVVVLAVPDDPVLAGRTGRPGRG